MKDHPSPRASHARRGALKRGRSSTSPALAAGPCTGAGLLAAVLLLAACASPPGEDADAGNAAAGGISQADDDLQLTVDRGDGSPVEEWSLTCTGAVEGTHPEAQTACAHLAGLQDPFAPLPDDVVCTEQFGGAQTAHVTGRWHGEPVDLQLSRSNGCLIAQWDSLGPLLPIPVG